MLREVYEEVKKILVDIKGRTYDPIFRNFIVGEVRQNRFQANIGKIDQLQMRIIVRLLRGRII